MPSQQKPNRSNTRRPGRRLLVLRPGAYDILLRLPGDERSTLISLTLLPAGFAAAMPQLEQALQLRRQARLEMEGCRPQESVALLESAIAAYQTAAQPNAAAEVMLDAAELYTTLCQLQKAATLQQRAALIRR